MQAVILAGGRGTRLRPYTAVLPKPLVPIGEMPILEIVIRQLRRQGIQEIVLAVGYLAELLMAYFHDGRKYGVRISYSKEDQPLGTAGPLSMIPDLDHTFLLLNGDVLTTLNYAEMIAYHREHEAMVTIAMHPRQVNIDLGVMETDGDHQLVRYIEKPTFNYQVSMGIYVFEPEIRDYLKPGERLDFPELIWKLLADKKRVLGYPYGGYWLDIGRPDDYARALEEFEQMRGQFLAEGG